MPSEIYNKAQVDAILAQVGHRIAAETDPAKLKGLIGALSDTNFLTDAERAKLSGLTDLWKGTFPALGAIPLTDNVAGMTAHVDAGVGSLVTVAYWDVDDGIWVQGGAAGGETAGSIKTKYESNPDTNPLTDALLAKLSGLTEASDISAAVAALDGAIT